MGKGFEQESGVPLTSVHNQVINAYKSPMSTVVTATSNTTLTSCTQTMLVLPGKLKMSTNFFLNQEPFLSTTRGLFSSKTPPVTLSSEVWAFPDDDTYFRSLGAGNRSALYSYCLDISKAKGCFRECPTGKQGNSGASGGSNNNSGSSSGGGSYSMWSIGGGSPLGSSGGVGGAGGGDDDPSKNPNNFNSGPNDIPFLNDEEINFYDYLGDAAIEELIRDIPFDDIVLPGNPSAGGFTQIREQTHSYPTEPSDRTTDPPSTPAPLTPGPCPVTPATPYYMTNTTGGYMGSPQETPVCVEQASSDNTLELLEIQKLMINSGGVNPVLPSSSNNQFPNQSASTGGSALINMSSNTATLVPQQPSYQETQRHHVPTVRPSRSLVTPQQQSAEQSKESIDFLTSKFSTDHNHHVISVYVPPDTSGNKFEVGHRALQHIYTAHKQYEGELKNDSLTELQVANQKPAQLCSMELGMQPPTLNFKMPKSCIPLSKWVLEDHNVVKRQLVIQQVTNSLTILFKAQNDLCFWGSAQLWIDSNTRVYLYIDFIKALAIQKEYAEKMLPSNPRVEDCKVLVELYNTVLKPYLQRDLTWISPQLRTIFDTFEDLLQNPSNCVINMAYVARVLGNRRICQLQLNLMIGTSFAYDVYCAEHENLLDALGVLSSVLPAAIARRWAVLRSRDNSPVGVTEIAAKEADCSYMMIPADGFQKFPGALYIESKQTINW